MGIDVHLKDAGGSSIKHIVGIFLQFDNISSTIATRLLVKCDFNHPKTRVLGNHFQ